MSRKEVCRLIESGECNVVSYETSRRYKAFIYNEQLAESCEELDRLPHDVYVIVVSTGVNNKPRRGTIL